MSKITSEQLELVTLTSCCLAPVALHTRGGRGFGFDDVTDTIEEVLICTDCGAAVEAVAPEEAADDVWMPF